MNKNLADIEQFFVSKSIQKVDLPMIMPLDPLISILGEGIRANILEVVSETANQRLCLRPDFTLAAALNYAESFSSNDLKNKELYYSGNVFRDENPNPDKMQSLQIGYEKYIPLNSNSNHNKITEQEDLNQFQTLIDFITETSALKSASNEINIIINDVRLLESLFDDLSINSKTRRLILKLLFRNKSLASFLDDLTAKKNLDNGTSNKKEITLGEAKSLVNEQLLKSDFMTLANRNADDIAKRYTQKLGHEEAILINDNALNILSEFLEINSNFQIALDKLKQIASDNKLENLKSAINNLENIVINSNQSEKITNLEIKTYFVRPFHYYTGLFYGVFDNNSEKPFIAGGSYNNLLSNFNLSHPHILHGFAFWPDRFV